jgi:hypothetical protein
MEVQAEHLFDITGTFFLLELVRHGFTRGFRSARYRLIFPENYTRDISHSAGRSESIRTA